MKNDSKSKAFSLIELSIVVLIIGILIAGVTQGSRLVRQSKLKIAKSLTQSSPVASIPNLLLWFETTSDNSFAQGSQIDDKTLMNNWHDINPQTTTQIIATQNTTANQPTYVVNGINGLPSLQFNGAPNNTGLSTFSYFDLGSTTQNLIAGNNLSVIMVYNVNNTTGLNYIIGEVNGWTTWRIADSYFQSSKGNLNNQSITGVANTTYVVSYIASNTQVTEYRNGQIVGSAATLTSGQYVEGNNVWIGGAETGGYYSTAGMVGEIMVFNRILKTSERTDIEKYLAKKWNIIMSLN